MKFKIKTFVKWIIKNWEILKPKKIYKINLELETFTVLHMKMSIDSN